MTKEKSIDREMERIARERFGFDQLHPGQREVIKAVVEGRDTLAVMPTGSGKSAIYQIAGLMLPGPTVVVSPLLALQRDQVKSLAQHGVDDAAAVNSSIPEGERDEAMEAMEENELGFLFTAPEQFHNEETLARLKAAKPALFVVDEAHCISEWGNDFRPDYLRLGAVIEELGHPAVLALTATASGRVREEIVERLGMRDPHILVEGFDRPNIWLGVTRFHDESVKRQELLETIESAEKPGIVYVSTRAHAEELATDLNERGIPALAYHAGLKAAERKDAEKAFMGDQSGVMVATSAFGMGVDKPDVRFVFHYDIPDSVDTYYQEIGRGGRDGQPATALLFYRAEDTGIHNFFAGTGKVGEEQVEQVARTIHQHDGPVDSQELQEATNLSAAKLTTALTRLEETGALDILPTGEVIEDGGKIDTDEIVAEAVESEEHRRAADHSRREMMRGYAELMDCRRGYILNYFGEAYDEPCGNCDNCQAGNVVEEDVSAEPFPLHSRVVHQTLGSGEVMRYEGDEIVVLFDDVGYKTLLTEFVVSSNALRVASDGA